MLPFGIVFFEGVCYNLQVFLVSQEIGVGGVDEKGFDIMLPDIARIGFLQIKKIEIRDGLFVSAVPLPDILLQLADRRM